MLLDDDGLSIGNLKISVTTITSTTTNFTIVTTTYIKNNFLLLSLVCDDNAIVALQCLNPTGLKVSSQRWLGINIIINVIINVIIIINSSCYKCYWYC